MKNKNIFILFIILFCAIFDVIHGKNYLDGHFARVYEDLPSQEKEKFPVYIAQFLNKHRFVRNIAAKHRMLEDADSMLDSIGMFPTHSSLITISGEIVHSKINNSFTIKLKNSASNGMLYAKYYNKSKNLNDFYGSSALLRQACYVPVDMAVSEGLDKVAELESVKIFTNNISEEKKKWFKKNLLIATSAATVDGIERLTRNGYSGAYNKSMPSLVANHLINEGIMDLVIEPYIVQPLGGDAKMRAGGIRCAATIGTGYYIAPYVAQAVKVVLG